MFFTLAQNDPQQLTDLKDLGSLLLVSLSTACGAFLFVIQSLRQARDTLKQTKRTADELLNAKGDLVRATERNWEAIQANTAVTQSQAIKIQKHLALRVKDEITPLKERMSRLEQLLAEHLEATRTQNDDEDDTMVFRILTEEGDIYPEKTPQVTEDLGD